ncbi:MAG: transcription termination factor Rho, partial [Solirubrobacteraceae bacterium]|nr:transcription termination factor Rho [Solirubrobacteraceae bacterium]
MLPRSALEESPLADLHVLASEIGLDGYRRLRKADLIDAIVTAQGGPAPEEAVAEDGVTDEDAETTVAETDGERPARRRSRRGGRGRTRDADVSIDEAAGAADAEDEADEEEEKERPRPRRRSGPREDAGDGAGAPERVAEGVIELLGNGSGFLRVSPPEPSDDDVYVSAAQVRRCELVAGDRVSGPVRPPRRSERYPSLVRVDKINDRPADEVAEGTHFDDLPCAFPAERFALGADDPTLKAIEWLTPLGRGSRVTLVGQARSGKSEALRKLAVALKGQESVGQLSVVLAGVRPEEIALWKEAGLEPETALTLAASPDAQAQAVERTVETARRV